MSLRDKSDKIVKQGARERANFTPEPGSAHLRVYQYWLKTTGRVPFKENFCHYWRVVFIWAPIDWLIEHTILSRPSLAFFRFLGKVFAAPIRGVNKAWNLLSPSQQKTVEKVTQWTVIAFFAMIALGLIVWGAIADFTVFLAVVGVFLGIVALVSGLVWVASMIEDHYKAKRKAAADERRARINRYYDEGGDWPYPEEVRKAPNAFVRGVEFVLDKIGGFFRGVWDFIVLAGNAIRVNKWKICPLVEIPTDD